MKFNLILDEEREEQVLVYAHKRSKLVEDIESLVCRESFDLLGYKDKSIVRIDPAEVCCFVVKDNKIYALIGKKKLQLKCRLYQLEGLNERFIKINQSCIANIQKIERFDASFSGSLLVVFKNGYKDYVSRRQMKNIKERFGL